MQQSTLPLTSHLILNRWKNEAPQMVADLEASGQLLPALNQANERLIELLYQLTVIQKMDYQAALEIAMNEWVRRRADRPRREAIRCFRRRRENSVDRS